MKARFTILMLVGAAWLYGAADKPASDRPVVQAGHASTMPARSRRGGSVRPGAPKRPPRSTRPPAEGVTNPTQRSGAPVERGALIPNPAVRRGTPDPSRGAFGRVVAPMGNVRHRSPNPPVIAGPADSGKRNAGVIAGNQVHRRP
jgi:hypothetical protein